MAFTDANDGDEESMVPSDEGDEDNEGALPEPDAEGRKIAELQEVQTLQRFFSCLVDVPKIACTLRPSCRVMSI